MKIIEQNVTTILRPTSINLAPYVINPYQGCQMNCCFCYAQFSKVAKKQPYDWGTYVKVKINAIEVLKKELDIVRPKSILLGSMTECFQPIEKKYKITRRILELLNDRSIPFIIMSRSDLIVEYCDLLAKGNTKSVYFTVNVLPDVLVRELKMNAPGFKQGIDVVCKLQNKNINVIAYFCPVLPWLTDIKQIIKIAKKNIKKAEFEVINFQMAGQEIIYKAIGKHYSQYKADYQKFLSNELFFKNTIINHEQLILSYAADCFEHFRIHIPKHEGYFSNKY